MVVSFEEETEGDYRLFDVKNTQSTVIHNKVYILSFATKFMIKIDLHTRLSFPSLPVKLFFCILELFFVLSLSLPLFAFLR